MVVVNNHSLTNDFIRNNVPRLSMAKKATPMSADLPSTQPPPTAGTSVAQTPGAAAEGLNAPPVPSDRYELRLLQSLRRIIRNIEIHSHRLIQKSRVTGPQLACLLALGKDGPLTGTALAKRVYLSPSTVVGIVDRLEEKGLLIRTRSACDRRQVLLALTDTGRKLTEESPSLLQDTLADRFKELPELEQASILLALEKVVDLMEARTIEAAPVLAIGPITAAPANPTLPDGT